MHFCKDELDLLKLLFSFTPGLWIAWTWFRTRLALKKRREPPKVLFSSEIEQ